jgi:hypothetical protein
MTSLRAESSGAKQYLLTTTRLLRHSFLIPHNDVIRKSYAMTTLRVERSGAKQAHSITTRDYLQSTVSVFNVKEETLSDFFLSPKL